MFLVITSIVQKYLKSILTFNKYGLTKKTLAYVKNENENLNTMTTILKSIVNCEILGVMEIFKGTCFGHVFFIAYQYTIVEKISLGA
jgi:hypothetical protein